MRIEVLYFPGCPHWKRAIEEVERALQCENMEAAVAEIEVRDEEAALRHEFWGSPTIRVNGRDVDPILFSTGSMGLRCRFYPGSKQPGVPALESLRSALREANSKEKD